MTICAPRRQGLTHEEFRRYVTQVHGPLVASVAEVAADLYAYHYNFPVASPIPQPFGHRLAETLDIVTQGWFESVEAQRANMRQARYLEIIRPDEGRFADEARAVMHYMRERPVTGIPSPAAPAPYKLLLLRRRRVGVSREAFQEAWLAEAGPLQAQCVAGSSGYLQNHAASEAEHPGGADPKYFDVMDEIALPDPALAGSFGGDGHSNRAAIRQLRALEQRWLEPQCTRALVTETVISLPWMVHR